MKKENIKKITFAWGAEKQIRVAEAGEPQSLFYEAYRQALAGVAEIIRASMMYQDPNRADPFFGSKSGANVNSAGSSAKQNGLTLYDYPNNIIVFSGERGAGKSSAMLTFVASLQDKDGKLFQETFLKEMVSSELFGAKYSSIDRFLHDSQFVSIPPIDPTTLENGGQVLTVILARMFSLAERAWEDRAGQSSSNQTARRNEHNELLKQFASCYEHINAIKNSQSVKPEDLGLDTLSELGDSSLLKEELCDLVDKLLQFCCPNCPKSSYLILQIDDTDMNIKQAYSILEDIRRYLVIPRLIIIMAADLKHMMQVVKGSLLQDYNKDLSGRNDYVEMITRQYITKLFPQTRQIDLPSLGAYFKEHTENFSIVYDAPSQAFPDTHDGISQDSQEQIFRLIYRKTGLVFLKHSNGLHYIIPSNMRLLAHFLSMLIQMEDVADPDKDVSGFFPGQINDQEVIDEHKRILNVRLQNLQRFRSYFLTTWVLSNLSDDQCRQIDALGKVDVAGRVRYACVLLNDLLTSINPTPTIPSSDCEYIDMVRTCQAIMDQSPHDEDKRFVFALRTYFSLLANAEVLEELIDHYTGYRAASATPKNSEHPKLITLGPSFQKLRLLFGVRLFPYPLNRPKKLSKSSDPRCFPDLKGSIKLRWSSNRGNAIPQGQQSEVVKDYAWLLFSMFAQYDSVNKGKSFPLDITNPILNCLYLGDGQIDPLSEDRQPIPAVQTALIKQENWDRLRESSLLIVLNSDVQERISQYLLCEAAFYENIDNISYSDWFSRLKAVYTHISDLFNQNQQYSIKVMQKLRFDGWLDDIYTVSYNGKVKDAAQQTIKGMQAVLRIGNFNITPESVKDRVQPTDKDVEKSADSMEASAASPEKTSGKTAPAGPSLEVPESTGGFPTL